MNGPYFDKEESVNITSRNLPHWSQKGKIYFVTFRLADSLPQSKLTELKKEREEWLAKNKEPLSAEQKKEYHILFSQKIDKWLDANYGSCVLKATDVCNEVEQAITFFDGIRHTVHGYVIMCNHVHLLIQPFPEFELRQIIHSIKSYSSHRINRILEREGQLWSVESYDRIVRDGRHYDNIKRYIVKNIRACLIKNVNVRVADVP